MTRDEWKRKYEFVLIGMAKKGYWADEALSPMKLAEYQAHLPEYVDKLMEQMIRDAATMFSPIPSGQPKVKA